MMIAEIGERGRFDVLIRGGGAIGYLIICLSVVMVALIVRLFIQIRRSNILPAKARKDIQSMIASKRYKEAIDFTSADGSYLSRIIHAALIEAPYGYAAMERAMEETAEEHTTRMLRDVEWLNLVGNLGPMLGLLGTVWGIIGAFFDIVKTHGTPSALDLAENIGIALVATLHGLALAIPALGMYGFFRNRLDALCSEAVVEAQKIISALRPRAKESEASARPSGQNAPR